MFFLTEFSISLYMVYVFNPLGLVFRSIRADVNSKELRGMRSGHGDHLRRI